MILRTFSVGALVVLATITLSACSPASSPAGDDATTSAVAGFTFSNSDIMFAQMMIPHHKQAIEMSALAKTRSTNPDILALAEQITAAQGPEIEQMTGWLSGAGASMDMGHSMHMDGVLSDEQMSALDKASGAEFDRLYLEGMIGHHEGAVSMAAMVVGSQNSEAAALGAAIVSSQTEEIAYMKRLLASL